jgi:predicted glycosyl hydrolase (DUF1957 family)
MMSSLKCLAKAEQCEALARTSVDVIGRQTLLMIASFWRSLAKQARRYEGPPGST